MGFMAVINNLLPYSVKAPQLRNDNYFLNVKLISNLL